MLVLAIAVGLGPRPAGADERGAGLTAMLQQEFDLASPRSAGTQYFDMVTMFVSFGSDGKVGETETFRVKLECVSPAAGAGDQYTCGRFVYGKPDGTQVTIPALEGWTYTFTKTETGLDEKGQVLGIDHARFRQLADSNGAALPPDKAYLVYNAFIDFHGFCDDLGRPEVKGKGIQHLTRIGQKIVHAGAHSTPPTHLGDGVKEGSYFKNGEITLELKGLSSVDEAPCAIVEFDSGACSFQMLLEAMPGLDVKTVGHSHYFGDIYVDLASRWPRKVSMRELVISETKIPMPGQEQPLTVNTVHERQTIIRAVTKEAYERD